ncbi:MAG: restriction endonuclease [Thermoproteota archaeon]
MTIEESDARNKLKQSALRYFNKKGYDVEDEKVVKEGYSGLSREFDLVVRRGGSTQPVWIKDWDRTIGVNIVIDLDKASADVGLNNPIVVGGKFSDHAKSYANRKKITLLTERQINRILRMGHY